jgi:hypothetical protein
MTKRQINEDDSLNGKTKTLNDIPIKKFRWVSIAIVSAILTLSGWALSSPIGSSPDDDFHLPSIWCGQGFRDGLCEEDTDPKLAKVPYTTFANSACFHFDENMSGVCPYDEKLTPYERVNLQNNLYPPVFYWTMSWFASDDIAASTIAMRVFNSILAVAGLALLLVALPHHLRRIPLLGLLISTIPLGNFLTASTNPSSWSFFGIVMFFSSLLGFISAKKNTQRWTLGAIAAISFIIVVGARADGAVYAVIAFSLAFFLVLSRQVLSPRFLLISLAIIVSSVIAYFSVATGSAVVGGALALPDRVEAPPSIFVNLASLPNLWIGVFGTSGLGWLDTEMPAIVWAVTLSIYTGLIFTSVRWFTLKQAIAVSLILLALIAIPLYILTVSGLSVGQQVQPRYLLPLIALLGAAALYRKSSTSGLELTRGQAWIIGVGLFIANTISLHLNARRYITGMDQQGVDLNENIEWWWSNFPLSPNIVTLSASIAFAIFLVAIWKLREPLGLPGNTKEIEAK